VAGHSSDLLPSNAELGHYLILTGQAEHPLSLAFVEVFATLLSQFRRDVATTNLHAAALMALATVQGFPLRLEHGRMLQGWVLAMSGETAAGLVQLRQGLTASQGVEPELIRPYGLCLLAEAYGQAGQPKCGLEVLVEALALAATTGACWGEAELYRLKGALLLQLPSADVDEAEDCFQHALAAARSQQAKALGLRAALSLSHLCQQQRKRKQASQLLAPIYGWFSEGLDPPDLREARALLAELA
jgi:predicted ATPase